MMLVSLAYLILIVMSVLALSAVVAAGLPAEGRLRHLEDMEQMRYLRWNVPRDRRAARPSIRHTHDPS